MLVQLVGFDEAVGRRFAAGDRFFEAAVADEPVAELPRHGRLLGEEQLLHGDGVQRQLQHAARFDAAGR